MKELLYCIEVNFLYARKVSEVNSGHVYTHFQVTGLNSFLYFGDVRTPCCLCSAAGPVAFSGRFIELAGNSGLANRFSWLLLPAAGINSWNYGIHN